MTFPPFMPFAKRGSSILFTKEIAQMRLRHLRSYFIYWWNHEKTDKQQDGAKSKNRMTCYMEFGGRKITVAFSACLRQSGTFL